MDYKMHIFYMCVEPLAIKYNTAIGQLIRDQ